MKNFILGVIASIVAGLIIPGIRNQIFYYFQYVYQKFSGNVIDLTDTWEANFCEKDNKGCTFTSVERIKLKQKGKYVHGDGEIGPPYPRKFKFYGTIFQELISGYYEKTDTQPGSLEGKGVFLLKIEPNRIEMSGYCSWHDLHSDDIETSKYEWKRL